MENHLFDFSRPKSRRNSPVRGSRRNSPVRRSHRNSPVRSSHRDTLGRSSPGRLPDSKTLSGLVTPAEQLLENLYRLRQQLMRSGALNDVSTDVLGYRIRKINRRINKINQKVEALMVKDLTEMTLTVSETVEDNTDTRKDLILEVLMPYMITLDTILVESYRFGEK